MISLLCVAIAFSFIASALFHPIVIFSGLHPLMSCYLAPKGILVRWWRFSPGVGWFRGRSYLPLSRFTKRRRARMLAKAKLKVCAATLASLIHFSSEGWLAYICHARGSHGHPRLDNYRSLEVRRLNSVGMLLSSSMHFPPGCTNLGFSESLSYHLPLRIWKRLSNPFWMPDIFSPCLGYPGEGPKLGFVTINATSASRHRNDLVALSTRQSDSVQIVFVQETRLSAKDRADFIPFLRQEGWDICIGYQPPVKRLKPLTFASRQPHGGIATLYRGGVTVIEIPISAEWQSLVTHCQLLWCSSQSGGFYAINCYLPAGSDKRHERSILLSRIFELAGSHSNFPVFIVGDFQDEPAAYPSIQSAFLTGEWVDLYANQQNLLELPIEASFAKSGWETGYRIGPGKTRIDYVLANAKAACLFQSIKYFRGCSFPGHTPILCTLCDEVLNEPVWVLKPHPCWVLPDKPTGSAQWAQRESSCMPILQQHTPALLEAAASQDSEMTWIIACRIATEMLNVVSQQNIPSTRGNVPQFRQRPLVPDATAPCRFSKAHKISRSKSLLRELMFRASHWPDQPKYCWFEDLFNTIRNLRTLCSQLQLACNINPQSSDSLQSSANEMLSNLNLFEVNLVRQHRAEHVRRWKVKLQVSSRNDKKEVHRWLKGYGNGPPKTFKTDDGTLVASPNAMLRMIEDHMQKIYNYHSEVDPYEAFDKFQQKYGHILDHLKRPVDLPRLRHEDLFNLFQKRSPDKASGLDGWATRELLQLPPCAWLGFCLCMQIAEATGNWPRVLKMISVTNIAKKPIVTSPEDTRAIGVSSAVYSTWSSLRFKQLATWMNQICPSNLLGGLANRTADSSELDLSFALHDPNSHFDLIAVFLDRWKCFDLILPHVALNVAGKLGLPAQIVRATLGFYKEQYKLFKLGSFYGKQVMCTNSAVQGCSMSVLMVNSMYAVLSSHMSNICPSINFSAFLDDTKIWTNTNEVHALSDAFTAINEFDVGVGQVLNEEKTTVATRRKKNATRFLLKVGRACKVKKRVRSLGFSHQFDKRCSPKLQDERVAKARASMAKISQLPLPPEMKTIHVHANGHSKWVYGSEVQGPSKHALARLRTATAKVFVKKHNNMRCPFLLFATLQDPWLDPFAKWLQHVMLKLRRLAYLKPELVRVVLEKVQSNTQSMRTSNGIASVVAFLFAEVGWKVYDASNLTILLADQRVISFKDGSREAFLEEMARDIRTYLINQSPCRYDNPTPGQYGTPDVFLTRFLLDTTFAANDDFRFLRGHIEALPRNIQYTRGILSALLSGSIYNGFRYAAAGLKHNNSCPHCGQEESHRHMFCDCEAVQEHRPPQGDEPLLSWVTGIFFEPPEFRQDLPSTRDTWKLPLIEERWRPHSAVFVDGSVFNQRWVPIRAGASAATVPGLFKHSVAVQGASVNSFRCELFALILALHLTAGDVVIATDCASVLRRAKFLQSQNFLWDCTFQFENPDLWEMFLDVARKHDGNIQFVKVKAHTNGHTGRCPVLTAGNEEVDALAKATAKALSSKLVVKFQPYLERAVAVQAHLIATLVSRTNACQLAPFDEDDKPPAG